MPASAVGNTASRKARLAPIHTGHVRRLRSLTAGLVYMVVVGLASVPCGATTDPVPVPQPGPGPTDPVPKPSDPRPVPPLPTPPPAPGPSPSPAPTPIPPP